MRVHLSFAVVLFTLAVGQPSFAASVAVVLPDIGGFQNSNYGSNITLGWGFTLVNAVTVTDLGYFDGNEGLTDPHPVGIWNSIGSLLAEATVPSGTVATLVSGFRFIPIVPVVLGPGVYSIGGYANSTSPDEFRFEVPSVTTVAGLSFGPANLFTKADSLTRPTSQPDVFTQDGYFGPNFLVGSPATTVPEPSTSGVWLLGLAIVMNRFLLGVVTRDPRNGSRSVRCKG